MGITPFLLPNGGKKKGGGANRLYHKVAQQADLSLKNPLIFKNFGVTPIPQLKVLMI